MSRQRSPTSCWTERASRTTCGPERPCLISALQRSLCWWAHISLRIESLKQGHRAQVGGCGNKSRFFCFVRELWCLMLAGFAFCVSPLLCCITVALTLNHDSTPRQVTGKIQKVMPNVNFSFMWLSNFFALRSLTHTILHVLIWKPPSRVQRQCSLWSRFKNPQFSPVLFVVISTLFRQQNYPEEEMLLVFDRAFTYGQCFYLVLTPEGKKRILSVRRRLFSLSLCCLCSSMIWLVLEKCFMQSFTCDRVKCQVQVVPQTVFWINAEEGHLILAAVLLLPSGNRTMTPDSISS